MNKVKGDRQPGFSSVSDGVAHAPVRMGVDGGGHSYRHVTWAMFETWTVPETESW